MSIDRIERTHLTLSAGAVAASLAFATPVFAASLAVGVLIEAVNFHGLRRSAQFLFWGEIAGGRGWSGVFALRFGLLVLGIGGALALGADPVGLIVGLSLIMPAAVFGAWRTRPPIDPTATVLAPEHPAWDGWNPWLARERVHDEDDDE